MRLLLSLLGATFLPEVYAGAQAGVAQLAPDDMSLRAERLRGIVLSHKDWVMADNGRTRLNAQWRELFRSFDAVICPIMPTPAYLQDESPEQETRKHQYRRQGLSLSGSARLARRRDLAGIAVDRDPDRAFIARDCRSACRSSARISKTARR